MPLVNHSIYEEQLKQLQNRHIEYFKKHIHRTDHVKVQIEDDRTGMTVEALKRVFIDNLYYILGKDEYWATPRDYYMAFAYTVRDRLLHRWLKTEQTYFAKDVKAVFYLSVSSGDGHN